MPKVLESQGMGSGQVAAGSLAGAGQLQRGRGVNWPAELTRQVRNPNLTFALFVLPAESGE